MKMQQQIEELLSSGLLVLVLTAECQVLVSPWWPVCRPRARVHLCYAPNIYLV